MQGFLEDSNVNPVSEIARMIEVQRAYELGQKFLDAEDSRMRGVIQTLGRRPQMKALHIAATGMAPSR
jgi:flagellar basal-body rod protein FlgF